MRNKITQAPNLTKKFAPFFLSLAYSEFLNYLSICLMYNTNFFTNPNGACTWTNKMWVYQKIWRSGSNGSYQVGFILKCFGQSLNGKDG